MASTTNDWVDNFIHDGVVIIPVAVFMCHILEEDNSFGNADWYLGKANEYWYEEENYRWVWEHSVKTPKFYSHRDHAQFGWFVKVYAFFTPEDEVLYHLTFGDTIARTYI
jgi:hypothetical protein